MKQVYCLSGLGADERIFSRLNVPGVDFIHLKWVLPEKNESMEQYAARLSGQVFTSHPIFLGVSFGGMMAVEIAKRYSGAKVILISSICTRKQLPVWMKLSGCFKLNRLVPAKPWKWTMPLGNAFLGAKTEEECRLCNEFRSTVDPLYLHWAIEQVLNWRNEWSPPVYYHIHGSKDRTFPLSRVTPTHIIAGGGHFMIMNQAKEVSEILAGIV